MMSEPGLFGWSDKPAGSGSEVEEGEVLEELSNDEDYSPGSLVIDHVEQGMFPVSTDISLERTLHHVSLTSC